MDYKHLKPWKLPSSYFGASWNDWYVFLGQNRDSDDLTESNFAVGLKAVKAVMSQDEFTDGDGDEIPTVYVVRENHWAVGWVEWIAIHKSDVAACLKADELLDSLKNYPVLDESDWYERESEHANVVWKECYNARERIEYIRENRSQFDFHDFGDLMACVRGKYFAGYASELIA